VKSVEALHHLQAQKAEKAAEEAVAIVPIQSTILLHLARMWEQFLNWEEIFEAILRHFGDNRNCFYWPFFILKKNISIEIQFNGSYAILLAITSEVSNQFRKAICHLKALNIL
jgi:hypothetical protein